MKDFYYFYMTSCILTVIKNEHEYLDEWIKYHLDLGVDHIFIFEDIDSNSHKEITDKYCQVTLNSINTILNDIQKHQAIELKKTKRYNVLHLYLKNAINWIKNNFDYDWCFVIDSDEFITLENKNNELSNILTLYKDYDALILQWKCYGANGLIDKPDYKEKGLIETYSKESTGEIHDNKRYNVKTCYKLNSYNNYIKDSHHYPSNDCNWCNTEFIKDKITPIYKNIYIRHYITKSWEEYIWKIKNRGFTWGKTRSVDFFFDINPELKDRKQELIKYVE